MTQPATSVATDPWALIDKEKRRDRILRRVSITAWCFAGAVTLILGALTALQVSEMIGVYWRGQLPWIVVAQVTMPFVIVVGILSVLIATLSTVGIFLRLRTASLAEIQLRLATLENLVASRSETPVRGEN